MKRITILLAGSAMLMAACGNNAAASGEETDGVKRVTAAIAVSERTEQKAVFTATVEAEAVNNIAPQNPMRIGKIHAEVGDRVRRGQRLVEMDASELTQAKVQMEHAEIEFRRADELYRIGGESKATWDARKLDYDVARTAYENLAENTALLSPVEGIVSARNYDNGDMYAAGTPILTVERIRPVKLLVHVSESRFAQVRKGMEVTIETEALAGEVCTGYVYLVYPTIDPSTRTFPVEIRLDNADERVRPGMFARTTLSFESAQRVLVPDRAVVKQAGSGERYVFIVRDGHAAYSSVTLGQRLGDRFEILSGVLAGETVITTGQTHLRKGDAVEIIGQ